MDIEKTIDNWIQTGNSYDTEKYLAFYHDDAVLDDPSVGRKFIGRQGIQEYFEIYFIGYNTHTRKTDLLINGVNNASLTVEFTGTFPEGKIGGTFEINFKGNKIIHITADLVS